MRLKPVGNCPFLMVYLVLGRQGKKPGKRPFAASGPARATGSSLIPGKTSPHHPRLSISICRERKLYFPIPLLSLRPCPTLAWAWGTSARFSANGIPKPRFCRARMFGAGLNSNKTDERSGRCKRKKKTKKRREREDEVGEEVSNNFHQDFFPCSQNPTKKSPNRSIRRKLGSSCPWAPRPGPTAFPDLATIDGGPAPRVRLSRPVRT